METTNNTCKAWIKLKGRGVYGKKPCTREATEGCFCPIHFKAYQRAVAHLKVYKRK